MARWMTIDLEVMSKKAETEFEEDECELRKARIDLDTIGLYYPSTSNPDRVCLDLKNGDWVRVGNTMEELRGMIEN